MWICQKILTFVVMSFSLVIISSNTNMGEITNYFIANAVNNDGETSPQHVVVVVVPSFSFQEIEDIFHSKKKLEFWKDGTMAALNVKPQGTYSYENNLITLALGKRTTYEDRQGKSWLAEFFQKQGVETLYIGNADIRNDRNRLAKTIISNDNKETVSKTEKFASDQSKINQEEIVKKVQQQLALSANTMTVIEWGDLHRLFAEQDNPFDQINQAKYRETLRRLENTLAELLEMDVSEMWLVSPMVHDNSYKDKQHLTPVFHWGKDQRREYSLYSPTTRSTTVISSTDLAVTWANYFSGENQIPYEMVTGHPLETKAGIAVSIEDLMRDVALIHTIFASRGMVLSVYVLLLVVVLVTVALRAERHGGEVEYRALNIVLLSSLASPFSLLISGKMMNFFTPIMYVLFIVVFSLVIGYYAWRWFGNPKLAICILLVVTMTIDLLLGGLFIKTSFLGYDPVIGARYYGIGNEWAGIMIGAALVMSEMNWPGQWFKTKQHDLIEYQTHPRNIDYKIMLISMFMIVVLGASILGANAGAGLSMGMVLLFVLQRRVGARFPIGYQLAIGVLLLSLLIIGLYLLQLGTKTSHIYEAFNALLAGETKEIAEMMYRKAAMNWKIFKASHWSQLFITSYILFAWIVWRKHWKKSLQDVHEHERKIMIVGLVASLALFFLNDSGIVAAATSMFIIVNVGLMMILEKNKPTRKQTV